uniref:RNA methyltransferase n=1 Tax=Plectus sambesii TaxID=2011161 RepID=A0A914VAQ9_9BILA
MSTRSTRSRGPPPEVVVPPAAKGRVTRRSVSKSEKDLDELPPVEVIQNNESPCAGRGKRANKRKQQHGEEAIEPPAKMVATGMEAEADEDDEGEEAIAASNHASNQHELPHEQVAENDLQVADDADEPLLEVETEANGEAPIAEEQIVIKSPTVPAASTKPAAMNPQPSIQQDSRSRHITVEAPALPPEKPYIENPLPGVADEVESYPCRNCAERVFLTSFGLERHTKMAHPEHLNDVMKEITQIQDEWKRREQERGKQRERLALAKIRQEALAAAAAREVINNSVRAESSQFTGYSAAGQHEYSTSGGEFYLGDGEGDYLGNNAGGGQHAFESCRICGLLINAEHPTAMENHMRAHKKNDELRSHLLGEYGPEFVARVTCHECQLVFTDERKLISHAEAMHVRRRKYVCKWCGHVCLTMTDLNTHKADVHGMPVSRSRDPDVRRQRQMASLTKGHGLPPPLGIQSAHTRRAVALAEASRAQQGMSPRVLTSVEELPCRTTCDFCGLIMVKPSLLIRHMMRVHNRTNFTATVETKGMPSFKINVDHGKLSWSCCSETYTDRSSFVYHRRSSHTPKLSHPGGVLARGVLEDGSQDGQQYLLVIMNNEGELEGDAKDGNGGPQQIVLTSEQMQQLGIAEGDGDNVVLLMDDGSGNMDGSHQLLQLQSGDADGEQQLLVVQGDGDSTQLVLDPNQIQQLLDAQGAAQ